MLGAYDLLQSTPVPNKFKGCGHHGPAGWSGTSFLGLINGDHSSVWLAADAITLSGRMGRQGCTGSSVVACKVETSLCINRQVGVQPK